MKHFLILSGFLCFRGIYSQTDTTKNFSLSGFQIELSGLAGYHENHITRTQLQKVVPSNDLLNTDLTGYQYGNLSGNFAYGAYGGRVYFSFKKKKKLQKDFFIGINIGSSNIVQINYNKSSFDTLSVYTNSTYQKIYQILRTDNTNNYTISNSQALIPIGLNFTTNKKRRFWLTFGAELGLGLTYNYVFLSSNVVGQWESLTNGNTSQNNSLLYSNFIDQTLIQQNSIKLKKAGFIGYVSAPVSFNLRLSKKVKFLKHLNLGLTLAPGCFLTDNAITGVNSGFSMSANFGLRYNLFSKF